MKSAFIPERLVCARERMNLSKARAAALLGLSPIGYLRYEQGLRTPSPQMLRIIALTLDTSVDYLTGVTDDPAADQILISRNDNSSLFELAVELNTNDKEQAERLLAYYKKMKI